MSSALAETLYFQRGTACGCVIETEAGLLVGFLLWHLAGWELSFLGFKHFIQRLSGFSSQVTL